MANFENKYNKYLNKIGGVELLTPLKLRELIDRERTSSEPPPGLSRASPASSRPPPGLSRASALPAAAAPPPPPPPPPPPAPPVYQTNIITENRIVAFSDIHADIHALIICLRDCAKVIRKRAVVPPFNQLCVDDDLERLLNIDISVADGVYIDDLNYEWVAENTYVVIVGDLLDGHRESTNPANNAPVNATGNQPHEYMQTEIKILRFINALNRQAVAHNSKIYKLLGNHEMMNILNIDDPSRYITRNTLAMPNYYRGFTRLNVFNVGNPGYTELFRDGCGLLLKINSNIFVHGKLLNKSYDWYHDKNQELNFRINTHDNFNNAIGDIKFQNSELWSRDWDVGKVINCDAVRTNITTFVTPLGETNDIRVIVGHCPQMNATNDNLVFNTFSTPGYTDRIIEQFIPPIYRGTQNVNRNMLAGITMDCPKLVNDFHIYHVDVGTSRAFDDMNKYNLMNDPRFHGFFNINRKAQYYNILFYARTPQILQITNEEPRVSIIKSSIINTRKHQPRPYLEGKIRAEILELDYLDTEENRCPPAVAEPVAN